MIYIFNRKKFESTASGHLVSYQPVSPDARLTLVPGDFCLFDRVHEIDSLEKTDDEYERLKTEYS